MGQKVLLELLGDVAGLLDIEEFRAGLLDAVGRAVPVDWISLNDLAPDPAETVLLVDPPFPAEDHELFAGLAHENPLAAAFMRTQDGRAQRFSDVCTAAELHSTRLYREFYGRIGLEHQIAFTLPSGEGRILALALSRRGSEPDFSDAERELLNAARPFLIQCYGNALEFSRLKAALDIRLRTPAVAFTEPDVAALLNDRGVTRRQREVLSLVSTGASAREVASALELSERTVHKHLQRCYALLGVHSRDEAVNALRARKRD